MPTQELKVALVHDWLTGMRGGEKCLELLCELWPRAIVHTLFAAPEKLSPFLQSRKLRTSFLQHLPGITRTYRHLLPLMPIAIENLRLPHVDAVVSTSHCVAKSIPVPHGVPHICYCHTPMRYAWHMRESYVESMRPAIRPIARMILNGLRSWDRRTAHRVTHYLANSKTVQQRIRQAYHRESTVVYPPVDTHFYTPVPGKREPFYLIVSALVPYKRLDLAVEACRRLDCKLVIIGTGEMESKLRDAAGTKTTFLGWASAESIRDHLRKCRALLFPGEEDFGIVPVEANACGAPVIAYGRGGATETVLPLHRHQTPTGCWFTEQTVESMSQAILDFEKEGHAISEQDCRRQALRFSKERYVAIMKRIVQNVVAGGHPMPIAVQAA